MIPDSLLAAHKRLAIDERGLVRGIRISPRFVTGPLHCLASWGESMVAEDGIWYMPLRRRLFGDVAYYEYERPLATDPVVTELPPVGSQVWQITPGMELRTSRIRRYAGAVAQAPWSYGAVLAAAGPSAGVPVGGDSGSVCWVRVGDRWLVLGMCSYGGRVEVSVPAASSTDWPVPTCGGFTGFDASPEQLSAPWVNPGGDTATQPATKPMQIPAINSDPSMKDSVGPHNPTPDGVPDEILDVASPFPLESITAIFIYGNQGEWRWPHNNRHWHVWRHDMPDDRLLLRINKWMPTEFYKVRLVAGSESVTLSVQPIGLVVAPHPPAPQPEPGTEVTPAPHVTAELEAKIRQLTSDNASLAMSNGDLRTQLNAEIVAHGETKARLTRLREVLREVIN